MKKLKNALLSFLFVILIFGFAYEEDIINLFKVENVYTINNIPEYSGEDFIYINDNKPSISYEGEAKSFEEYGELDDLGRCTYAYALLGKDLMPEEKREDISSIKPTGYQISKYDFIDQEYLYNRCHLIAYSLTGENLNKNNLITCTRSMNTGKMLDIEEEIVRYIKKTNNHVLYKVVPIFESDNLLSKGVHIEAKSIEDSSISYNVFVYNVEEGIEIDYKDGTNKLREVLE